MSSSISCHPVGALYFTGYVGRCQKFSLSICFLSKCPFWLQPWGSSKDFKVSYQFVTRTKMKFVVDRDDPPQKGAEAFDRVLKKVHQGNQL